MSSRALVAIVDAPVFEIPARTEAADAAAPASAQEPVVEIPIPELVRIEERLALQAYLGDLHPSHARQLAAVAAELDRRWATFA